MVWPQLPGPPEARDGRFSHPHPEQGLDTRQATTLSYLLGAWRLNDLRGSTQGAQFSPWSREAEGHRVHTLQKDPRALAHPLGI